MSLFKIKLEPIVKDREYEMHFVTAGRKVKTCATCGKIIPIGKPAMTFLKRKNVGALVTYDSTYTCEANSSTHSPCTLRHAEKLHIRL